MVYIIDSRYIEKARQQVLGAEVVLEQDAPEQLAGVLKDHGVKRVYLEDTTPIAAWKRLQEKIQFVEYDISSTLSSALMSLREIKDEEELCRMRRAQAITDACFTHILSFVKEGARELDLALEMGCFMRKNGADKDAFGIICVGGANSSLPHGVPGDYRLAKGDFLTLDFGARYKGYCSDMTRTVAIGEPGEEKRKVYGTVLKAHLAGIAAAKAGLEGRAVDKAARDIIDGAGYKGCFGHGLGHALGIEIHENPRFSPKENRKVRAGMVMTVEPGIYLEGRFGCRIEDAVLLGETGCEPLPKSPKELIVL
jgi:Xaa-Pro aminopeptidase